MNKNIQNIEDKKNVFVVGKSGKSERAVVRNTYILLLFFFLRAADKINNRIICRSCQCDLYTSHIKSLSKNHSILYGQRYLFIIYDNLGINITLRHSSNIKTSAIPKFQQYQFVDIKIPSSSNFYSSAFFIANEMMPNGFFFSTQKRHLPTI